MAEDSHDSARSGPDRRLVLRGGAAFGVVAAVGLTGCGGGSSQVAADIPAPQPVAASAVPAPVAVRTPVPTRARPRKKSELYRRGPGDVAETDPVPTRSPRPASSRIVEDAPASAEREAATPFKSDELSTARRRDEAAPKPEPAPKRTPKGRPPLARAEDIPVGGGMVFEADMVVVTQPTAGQFKGFDATCTHTGCLVAEVADGTINCFCHGSKFSIADGTVTAGPADAPLAARPIEVAKGEIRKK